MIKLGIMAFIIASPFIFNIFDGALSWFMEETDELDGARIPAWKAFLIAFGVFLVGSLAVYGLIFGGLWVTEWIAEKTMEYYNLS